MQKSLPRVLFLTAFLTLILQAAAPPAQAAPKAADRSATTTAAIASYRRQATELATSITAYRAAIPAFAELAQLNREVVIPWAERAAAEPKPGNTAPPDGNSRKNRPLIQNITGACYKSVYPGFDKLRQGGRIGLTPREARNFTTMLAFVRQHSTLIANPRASRNPFPDGTAAHAAFDRELAVAVALTAAPLKPLVLRLPPELEKKKQAVRELYIELLKALPPAESQQIQPFHDAYLEDYVRVQTRLEAFAPGAAGLQ